MMILLIILIVGVAMESHDSYDLECKANCVVSCLRFRTERRYKHCMRLYIATNCNPSKAHADYHNFYTGDCA
jgi:hypothetical protein